jgi:hypothetical protein
MRTAQISGLDLVVAVLRSGPSGLENAADNEKASMGFPSALFRFLGAFWDLRYEVMRLAIPHGLSTSIHMSIWGSA